MERLSATLAVLVAWPGLTPADAYLDALALSVDAPDENAIHRLSALLREPLSLSTASEGELRELPGITALLARRISLERGRGKVATLRDLVAAGLLTPAGAAKLRTLVQQEPHAAGGAATVKWRGHKLGGDMRGPDWSVRFTAGTDTWQLGGAFAHRREQLSSISYEATDNALKAHEKDRIDLHALAARWNSGPWHFVVGTFRVGAYEGLTLNNTRRSHPEGLEPDFGQLPVASLGHACRSSPTSESRAGCGNVVAPQEIRLTFPGTGFRGAGVAWKAQAWKAFLFGSSAPTRVYQYDVGLVSGCRPEDCPSTPLLSHDGSRRLKWRHYEDVFHANVVGGGVEARYPAWHVGLVGFRANVKPADPALVLRPGATLSVGSHDGIGLGFRAQGSSVAVSGELSHHASPDTMGHGARLVVDGEWKRLSAQLSARHYGRGYRNPWARGGAQPDEVEGSRQRGERGVRAEMNIPISESLTGRIELDVWRTLGRAGTNLAKRLRVQWDRVPHSFEIRVERRDKQIRRGGRAQCYAEGSMCAGERRAATLTYRFERKRIRLVAQHRRTWADAQATRGRPWLAHAFMRGRRSSVLLSYGVRRTRGTVFLRQRRDALGAGPLGEHELRTGFLWSFRVAGGALALRIARQQLLDQRPSSRRLSPNPAWIGEITLGLTL